MSRGRLATALALVALAGLGLLAPSAGAAPHGPPPPALLREAVGHGPVPSPRHFFQPVIELGEHGGYEVEVFGGAGTVLVIVHRGERAASWYVAHGVANANRVEASFGKFGEVSMGFQVSSDHTWERRHRKCRGRQRYVNRRGVFAGRLRFRGEKGYVSVRVHRAKGYVTAVAPQCERSAAGELDLLAGAAAAKGSSPIPTTLQLSWLDGTSSGVFYAVAREWGTGFYAETAKSEGKLAIFRGVKAKGGAKRLRVDEELTTARTNPPAPFSGSGVYRAAPDGTFTWSGALKVNFPGAPNTPLTDAPFKARLSGGI